ncbi:MAG: SMC family ATPase [Bacteroidales bacterium]|nr:SMC family ATPase [Bacteroidales bacterium]
MIPQTLTIEGLYSYQHKQKIDFRHLLEGQLFGIFGSVGSGKSAILEAITFALYGETDRLNSRENRNYNMMNLKSDELAIDFEFVNHDGKVYRYTVHGKRHGTDFENVRTYQRKAYEKVDNDWIPVDVSRTPQITGLTYDNFRRTIIIPQGKFQEFLQLTDRERTNMMKEIFNLEKFEFYGQTAALEKKNSARIHNLEGQLSHYHEITRESLKEQEKDVTTLAEKLEAKKKQRLSKEEEVKSLEKLKELFDDLQQKKKKYDELAGRKEAWEQREKKLEAYEKAQRDFKNIFEQKARTEKELTGNRTKYGEEEVALKQNNKTLEQRQKQLAEAEKEYNTLDDKKKEKEDYELWMKALAEKKLISELQGRIANGNSEIDKVKEQKQQLEEELKEQEKHLEELKKQVPDQNRLAALKTWFATKNGLLQNQQQFEKDILETQAKINASGNKIQEIISAETAQKAAISGLEDPEKVKQALISFYGKLENTLSEADHELEHLRLKHKLEEFTDALKQGEPCPLCGSEKHPDIMDVENVNEQLKEAQQQRSNLKQEMKRCNDLIMDIRNIQSEQKQLQEAQIKAKKISHENEKKLQAHDEKFSWEGYDKKDESQVDSDLKKASQLQHQISELEKVRKKKYSALSAEAEKLKVYENKVQEIKDAHLKAKSNKESYTNQMKILKPEALTEDLSSITSEKEALAHQIRKIDRDYKGLRQQVQELNEERAGLKTSLERRKEAIDEDEKALKAMEKTLHEKLELSDFTDIAQVKQILKWDLDADRERREIETFKRDWYAAEQDLERQRQKIKGQKFEQENYRKVKEEYEALQEEYEAMNKEFIEAKHQLDEGNKNLKAKEQMESELDNLQKRAENLSTLKHMFKGSGFVNYVSSVYLQNLCQVANERFYKLTRQQMQLEVDDNNNFRVRDFLNNGHVRSVKTLSGGQTFQASLSLALALASSVQQTKPGPAKLFLSRRRVRNAGQRVVANRFRHAQIASSRKQDCRCDIPCRRDAGRNRYVHQGYQGR